MPPGVDTSTTPAMTKRTNMEVPKTSDIENDATPRPEWGDLDVEFAERASTPSRREPVTNSGELGVGDLYGFTAMPSASRAGGRRERAGLPAGSRGAGGQEQGLLLVQRSRPVSRPSTPPGAGPTIRQRRPELYQPSVRDSGASETKRFQPGQSLQVGQPCVRDMSAVEAK